MTSARLPLALVAVAIAATLCASTARAQQVQRIGFLGMDSTMQAGRIVAFRDEMRRLGYVEGRNLTIEYRWAEGRFDRLQQLAAELAAQNVEVLVTAAPPAVRAAQKATSTIPIVMIMHDPVAMGVAPSLVSRSGNLTGVAFPDSELSTKRLDLLRSVVPDLQRVAIIWNELGGGMGSVKAVEGAAESLKITTRAFEIRQPGDLAAAVAEAKAWGAQGVVQNASPVITKHRKVLLDALAAHRLPATCELRLYVDEGCLMTYSADLDDMFRDVAGLTVRILKGAKPGDLAIQQPRSFDFVVNVTTAASLGLVIPRAVLYQTTRQVR